MAGRVVATRQAFDYPATGGESNTASNVGTGAIGIYKQKVAVDLQFKTVDAASSKMTLVDDTANSRVTFDVNEAGLTLGNLGGTLGTGKGGTGLTAIGSANQVLGVNAGASGLEFKTVSGTAPVVATHGANSIALSLAVTPANPGGAVALQASTPGTQQTGNLNLSGAGVFGGALSGSNLSGTNTGDQTITLTSDVTGSGTGSFATTIAAGAVTLAKMANMATASFLGRNTAGTGVPEVLSIATAKTMLNLTGTNSGDQTITLTGDVTGSGTGSFATTLATVTTGKGGTGLTTIGSANQVLGVNNAANALEYKTITAGSNITVTHGANSITIAASGSTGYGTVQEEGSNLTQRATLNFIGSYVTAADNAGSTRTDVTFGTVGIGAGGTGQTTQTAAYDALNPNTTRGDLTVRGASNNVRLAIGATGTVLHGGTDPTWSAVSLTADISGILAGANGGTGNGFFAVSGPTTSLKTFTFPNASATVLTSNAAVTVGQGGTGLTTLASGKMWYASALDTISALSQGNSVTIVAGVLDAIQDIRTTATPQWTRLGIGNAASATSAIKVTGNVEPVQETVTFSATPTFNWTNGNRKKITLTGNITSQTFSNPTAGSTYSILYLQDGTGSRTVSWSGVTIKWFGGSAPTITGTLNKADLITLYYDGTSYYGGASQNG